jgi:hypothetical protein
MSTSFGGASILALIEIVCYIKKKRGKNMKRAAFGAAFICGIIRRGKLKSKQKSELLTSVRLCESRAA